MKKKNIIMLSIIILFSNVVLCHAKVENKVPKVKIHYVKILDENSIKIGSVSYTHLTLPTTDIV